ncbi:MAG: tetratricopeptide repeat protein [Polyangiaceae bacterium]|nr:tetratricopeptide repeat protein [Polyangiaceae bacterium]
MRIVHRALAALALLALPARAELPAVPLGEAPRARAALARLDLDDARRALDGLSDERRDVARARALLAIYEGDCDLAATLLARHAGASDSDLGGVDEVARGCARVTAGAVTVKDEARGVWVRLVDDADAPLVPYLVDAADAARASLERDLGVALPRPLRIELVRDQYGLALMTGLPEAAAATTGTVAVAKWGKVIMLSPRAMAHGYGWADTLAHELTHLAVTRASRDLAPLWLQEGVAKREESRWRPRWPFDDDPAPEAVAKAGFERGLALPLDKLGPSIAMLPSGEQAMIAYAEVHAFVRYLVKQRGDDALAKLFAAVGDRPVGDPSASAALLESTGRGLAAWSAEFQRALAESSLPAPRTLGGARPDDREVARAARLGELLLARGHARAAIPHLERVTAKRPRDPSARAKLAEALRAEGQRDAAAALVTSLEQVDGASGPHLALRSTVARERGEPEPTDSGAGGRRLDPYSVQVACGEERPSDPIARALCDAAHQMQRR